MMILARMVLVCLWTLLVVLTTEVYAEEQRCKDLGANCNCSEPLNAPSYTYSGGGGVGYYNPSDSTTKECAVEAGAAVVSYNDVTATNATSDPAIFSALPAAHTNTNVLRRPYGHEGTYYIGQHVIAPSGSTKQRLAARWYIYHHPDTFSSTDCGGSKLAQLYVLNDISSLAPSISDLTGKVGIYNFTDWTPAQDCCQPFTQLQQPPGPSYWQGKWIRVEVVIARPNGQGNTVAGTGPAITIYLKDVTTAGAQELTVVDTTYPGIQLNPGSQNRTPPGPYAGIEDNGHRQNPKWVGGPDIPCIGFKAMSYYMAASWDTDSGQRIGAAYEIEGGGDVPAAPSGGGFPAAPTGLTVSQ